MIVGAGFAGISAAWRLQVATTSDRIVFLDFEALAERPARRNSRFMIDLPHDLASDEYGGQIDKDLVTISQNQDSIAFARDMVDALTLPADAYRPVRKINAAASGMGL